MHCVRLALQCCTQGTTYSSNMPASGSWNTLTPAYPVQASSMARECSGLFGSQVPARATPPFMKSIKSLVLKVGNIVFTNGDLDGWAGGSYNSWKELLLGSEGAGSKAAADAGGAAAGDVPDSAAMAAATAGAEQGDTEHFIPHPGGSKAVAFVTYKGASHCTGERMWYAAVPCHCTFMLHTALFTGGCRYTAFANMYLAAWSGAQGRALCQCCAACCIKLAVPVG